MAAVVERRLGDVTLSVLEAGEGGRPLLLTHGFTGAKEDFGDWIDRFAEAGWWVVAPDLRGHGSSDQPADEDAYSLAIYAEDLAALVAQLGWDRHALLGHSMGGMIAQELVLHPEHGRRVERLVLMDTDHGPIGVVDPETVAIGVEIVRSQGVAALVELLRSLPQEPRAPSDEALRANRPGYAEFADGKTLRCAAAMYAAMALTLVGRPDRLDDLATLELPILVVVGEEDRGFVAPSQRMADAIARARLEVIPDAAHSPQFENPERWWEVVSGFLAADLADPAATPGSDPVGDPVG